MEIQQATHRVELGGEVELVNASNFREVCDRLVARHGGQPKVTAVTEKHYCSECGSAVLDHCPNHPKATVETALAPKTVVGQLTVPASVIAKLPLSAPLSSPTRTSGGQPIDEVGKARSNAARLEMKLNGFAPKMPIYDVGSRVVEWGVDNARQSRQQYDALPLIPQVCGNVVQAVAREDRRDVVVERLAEVRMRPNGLVHSRPDAGGLALSEPAFGGLINRAGIGKGHSYLAMCPPELRALNINHWMEELKFSERTDEVKALASKTKWEPKDAKFRTRLNRVRAEDGRVVDQREIFAVVSGSYGAFDADKIAQALSIASPDGARGKAVYDGTRLKAEVLFHTNVAPEQFVAGEFFKAGVIVRSDDTGGGAIRISAVVWQNLCLNLIILDECVQEIKAIRHVGSVEALAKKFQEGFAQALGTIDGFLAKWNYAVQDDVGVGQAVIPDLSIEAVLPGLFNGIIERELVPVRGQRKDIVKGLLRMHELDKSAAVVGKDFVSRAAVVNAFTRYAHEVNNDPFEADAIERSAGGLLNITRANKVLPYEPIDF